MASIKALKKKIKKAIKRKEDFNARGDNCPICHQSFRHGCKHSIPAALAALDQEIIGMQVELALEKRKERSMVNAKLHIICGNCGSNLFLEYTIDPKARDVRIHLEPEVFITCGNCDTIHTLSDTVEDKTNYDARAFRHRVFSEAIICSQCGGQVTGMGGMHITGQIDADGAVVDVKPLCDACASKETDEE